MRYLLFCLTLILVLSGCQKKDHTFYESHIGFANKTSFDIEVQLYPKSQYLQGSELYRAGTSGEFREKQFKLFKGDSIWFSEKDLFNTTDTLAKPINLIGDVFDSIKVFVKNPDSTILKFTKIISTHYLLNPYQTDSIWVRNKLLNSMFDMGWNGFQYHYTFFIDKKFLSK